MAVSKFMKREDTLMAKTKIQLSKLYNCLNSRKSIYFLVYSAIFAVVAIGVFSFYFFAGKTFIWEVDGWEQHYKALIYYSQYLRDFFKNIFINHQFVVPQWDFAIGEGSDILGTFHYYVIGDPFAFFCFLFPAKYMYVFYEAMIILRIYLSGIVFSELCFYMGHERKYVLPGAVSYTFCYWAIYNAVRHPFFLNPLLYFPMLVLGVEKIIREKKAVLFTVTVTLAAVSNFYFFYMLVLTTIIYVVIRFVFIYGKNIRDWGKGILRLAVSSITGLCMAGVIFLPVLYFFMSDSRFKSSNKLNLLYPFSYYVKLPGFFTIEGDNFWTCMGFAIPVLLAVFLMFKERRNNRQLKTYFITCVVIMLIPLFGQILNGLSYMCNRWIYAFALLCAYILVKLMPRLISLERKDIKFLSISLAVYFAVCMCIKYSRNWKLVCVIVIGAALLAVLSCRKAADELKITAVVAAVMLACISNGIWKNAPFGDNYADECISIKQAQEDVYGNDYQLIKESDGDQTSRYSGSTLTYNANSINGISSSNLYWTLTNSYVSKFRYDCAIRLDTLLPHKYTGYDDRTYLLTLASTSGYIIPKSGGTVPYGFTYETENNEYVLYKNDNALPLGYTYDKAVNKSQWETLNYADRQKAMLEAVVISRGDGKDTKDTLGNRVDTSELLYDSKEQPYTLSYNDDDIQIGDGTFAVTKAGAEVTFNFDGVKNSETYFNINGLEYEGASEFQLYYGNKKYDPQDVYSKDRWKSLSATEKRRIFKNFIYWTQSTSSVTLDFTTDTGISKSMNYFTRDYSYYSNQHDFVVNMGYSSGNVSSITVRFQKIGVYSYDDINIISQPMDKFLDEVAELRKNTLEDVKTGNNIVTGNIELDTDKYLCLTIPYSKGWKVYVDGVKDKLYNANGQYMAVYLTSGKHDIRLEYSTPLLKEGAYVSLIGIIMFAAGIIIDKYRKKRNI